MIRRAVPVLAATDIAESVAFYRLLGFNVVTPMETYAVAEGDSAEILTLTDPAPERTGCYLVVSDMDTLYDELRGSGHTIKPPIRQPWGLTELYVVGPAGNLIRFAAEES